MEIDLVSSVDSTIALEAELARGSHLSALDLITRRVLGDRGLEARGATRARIASSALYRTGAADYQRSIVCDVSLTGAFLQQLAERAPLVVGSRIHVVFFVPSGSDALKLDRWATVRWVGASHTHAGRGFGVQFDEPCVELATLVVTGGPSPQNL